MVTEKHPVAGSVAVGVFEHENVECSVVNHIPRAELQQCGNHVLIPLWSRAHGLMRGVGMREKAQAQRWHEPNRVENADDTGGGVSSNHLVGPSEAVNEHVDTEEAD